MLKKSPVPACLSRWTCISVAIHLWHHICSHECRPVPQTCTCIHIHINVCIRFERSFRHASGRKSSGPDRMLRKCFSHKLTEVFWPVLLKTACLAAEAAGKCILHHISLGPSGMHARCRACDANAVRRQGWKQHRFRTPVLACSASFR